jgi:hypothetical protein
MSNGYATRCDASQIEYPLKNGRDGGEQRRLAMADVVSNQRSYERCISDGGSRV